MLPCTCRGAIYLLRKLVLICEVVKEKAGITAENVIAASLVSLTGLYRALLCQKQHTYLSLIADTELTEFKGTYGSICAIWVRK